MLPGRQEMRYMKIPVVLLMVLDPALGGVYMMFLLFIGFALLFEVAGTKVIAHGKATAAARMAKGRR